MKPPLPFTVELNVCIGASHVLFIPTALAISILPWLWFSAFLAFLFESSRHLFLMIITVCIEVSEHIAVKTTEVLKFFPFTTSSHAFPLSFMKLKRTHLISPEIKTGFDWDFGFWCSLGLHMHLLLNHVSEHGTCDCVVECSAGSEVLENHVCSHLHICLIDKACSSFHCYKNECTV